MSSKLVFITLVTILLSTIACRPPQNQMIQDSTTNQTEEHVDMDADTNPALDTVIMKGVGIHIPQSDFTEMRKAGIDILTTEWGMEQDVSKARLFLDRAYAAGLKVVLDGGFTDTAWGFTDDDWNDLPKGKQPIWQKSKVQSWITTFKDHPAVFAWDICNEYGENLPSGAITGNPEWPKTAISLDQLKQARYDVLQIDPDKPILIRTYEWESGEPPLGHWRPFEAGIADIVMLNLYSNHMEHNRLTWPEVIQDRGAGCVKEIKWIDPKTQVWISISAFEDLPSFRKTTPDRLNRDIIQTLKISNIDGLAFFAWGPVIGDDMGKSWYLPDRGADLWVVIKRNIDK